MTSSASGNGMSMNGNMAPNSSAAANAVTERLAQTAIGLAPTDPRHRDDALAFGSGLSLDDPLVTELLFLFALLVEVVLENREYVAAGLQLLGDSLPAALDLRELLAKAREALLCAVEMASHAARLDAVTKEQVQRAELAELLERATRLFEQGVLLALQRERVELARDRLQVAL